MYRPSQERFLEEAYRSLATGMHQASMGDNVDATKRLQHGWMSALGASNIKNNKEMVRNSSFGWSFKSLF